MFPEPLKNLADLLKLLPSIGPRQAIRLALFIARLGREKIAQIGGALDNLNKLRYCERCFFVHQNEASLCGICQNPLRDKGLIAVVEKETDLISLEATKKFNGRYLILGELQKNGILEAVHKSRLASLKKNIKELPQNMAEEIIVATNPTSYGDLNSAVISAELKDFTKRITRLGRGIPTGGEIEFADTETLGHAIDKRE